MSYETLCRVYRGGILESVHQGTVVVADTEGNIRFSLGDPHMLYFPRSSLKMIQALEFCRSGAYCSLGLSPQHLALCCASHDAESLHTDMIKDWLGKMNLSADNLACGPAQPNHERTKLDMYKRGEQPTRVHHECSGKHCGFISTAVHQGHDTATYHLPENPVQRKLSENMALMGGPVPGRIFWAVDGCRLPTPAILTEEMAVMTAKFAGSKTIPADLAEAAVQITDAVSAYPEYVSGTENRDRRIISALKGKLVLKIGAEASYAAVLPQHKLGIAIKIADGNPRSLPVVLIHLLKGLNVITDSEYHELRDLAEIPVLNSLKEPVGVIKPFFDVTL